MIKSSVLKKSPVIRALSDPQSLTNQIESLEKAEASYAKTLAKLTEVKTADAIIKLAAEAKEDADRRVASAEQEAVGIMAAAKLKAEEVAAKLKEVTSREAEAIEHERVCQNLSAKLAEDQAECQKLTASLAKEKEAVLALKEEYETKLSKIKIQLEKLAVS